MSASQQPGDNEVKIRQTATKCRFPLGNETSATLTLPDGRKLGYAQYGSPTGRPVIHVHGLPGSRIEIACLDGPARELGARIIAVERPGYGWSSPQPNRTMVDHVKDIQVLVEHLGLQEYGVLGVSGGGPYALACAALLPPDQLKAVAVVCGMGTRDMSKRGMRWLNWGGFTIGYRYLPSLTRWWFKRDALTRLDLGDDKRLELFNQQFSSSSPHEKDVAVFKDPDVSKLMLQSAREAYAQGMDGLLLDGKLMSMDWGFRLEDIRKNLPVHLWYGKVDEQCPAGFGKQIAARLGNAARLRIQDETHLSIFVNWQQTFLKDLVEAM